MQDTSPAETSESHSMGLKSWDILSRRHASRNIWWKVLLEDFHNPW